MTNHSDLSPLFSALSDPTRRAVVEQLATGPATVSTLAKPHDMALPTFLRHLDVLEKSGLISSHKKGRVRTCHIEAQPLEALQGWLQSQRSAWAKRLNKLDRLTKDLP